MSKIEEDLSKYCYCMEEVKTRLAFLTSFVSSDKTSLGREDFDYELACIHLRRILELIAFSTLVANKDKYAEVHEKYLYEWRPGQLLKNVAKINPDFYPSRLLKRRQSQRALQTSLHVKRII